MVHVQHCIAIFTLIMAMLTLQTGCKPRSASPLRVLWEASVHSAPVPNHFLYLMFPKGAENIGAQIPDRGILCSQRELSSGKAITFYDDANAGNIIERRDVTAEPDVSKLSNWVKNLNQTIQHWGTETEWKEVRLDCRHHAPVTWKVCLTVELKNGQTRQFDYDVDHGVPKAVRMLASSHLGR